MKKATFALTTLAALTVTAVAFAQGPAEGPTPPRRTTLTAADVTAAPPPPPARLPARETITVRQSYRPNRPLLLAGGTTLIASYAATAALTGMRNVRDASGDQPTYIPVVGPWLHLANSGSASMLDKVLIGGSGVLQGAGLLTTALSLIIPERVPTATIEAGGVHVHVTVASFGMGSAGVGAAGRF